MSPRLEGHISSPFSLKMNWNWENFGVHTCICLIYNCTGPRRKHLNWYWDFLFIFLLQIHKWPELNYSKFEWMWFESSVSLPSMHYIVNCKGAIYLTSSVGLVQGYLLIPGRFYLVGYVFKCFLLNCQLFTQINQSNDLLFSWCWIQSLMSINEKSSQIWSKWTPS